MVTSRRANYAMIFLLITVMSLSIFGLIMLYSTTSYMYGEQKLKQQTLWILLGIVTAVLVHRIDYRKIGTYSHIILIGISIPLFYLGTIHILSKCGMPNSTLSHFPFIGEGAIKGAYRWLSIGNRTIQPSEFAKLAIIIYLARYFGSNPRYVESFKYGLVKPLCIVGAVIIGILIGGSLSITVITCAVVMGMFFIAGIRLRYFIILIMFLAMAFIGIVTNSPVRSSRITSFLNPEKYKQTTGYQLYSSQLALGSGHWYGLGFNNSRMKEYYLPEAHTDFIMAIVGEELGFVAMLSVIILYLAFIASTFMLSANAVDKEGMLLAFGIGCSIGIHALINIGVVSGFFPTTGVTAPLISYGGSSMLMTWISIGILWNIVRTIEHRPKRIQTTSKTRKNDDLRLKKKCPVNFC